MFTALSGQTLACLKAGACPGNSEPSGSCRPPWTPPTPSQTQTGWLPPCPHQLWQQGLWSQQDIVLGEGGGSPVNTLTVVLTAW